MTKGLKVLQEIECDFDKLDALLLKGLKGNSKKTYEMIKTDDISYLEFKRTVKEYSYSKDRPVTTERQIIDELIEIHDAIINLCGLFRKMHQSSVSLIKNSLSNFLVSNFELDSDIDKRLKDIDIVCSYCGLAEFSKEKPNFPENCGGDLRDTIKLERLAEIINLVIKKAESRLRLRKKANLSPVRRLIVNLNSIIESFYTRKGLFCEILQTHIYNMTVLIYEWAHGKPPLFRADGKWSESSDYINKMKGKYPNASIPFLIDV